MMLAVGSLFYNFKEVQGTNIFGFFPTGGNQLTTTKPTATPKAQSKVETIARLTSTPTPTTASTSTLTLTPAPATKLASTLPPTPVLKVQPSVVSAPTPQVIPQTQIFNFTKVNNARIIFLHHSTGWAVYNSGVKQLITEHNEKQGTMHNLKEMEYPSTSGGYPWDNYPYDYYNLWVKHKNNDQDRKELNLDQLAAEYDVIIFKHCFPVSSIQEDTGKPNVDSKVKSLENYKLQYNALKKRMLEFPTKRFLVWTGAALSEEDTNKEQAQRSKEWANWVKTEWNTPDDNIFVFDFEKLETEGGLYLKYPNGKYDSHPDGNFSKIAAAAFVKRIVEVIEK
jgi:hypothetical protein